MNPTDNPASALDSVAHVIQVSLTPVFLLAAFAQLFNVLSTRLTRVADAIERWAKTSDGALDAETARFGGQLAGLRRQSLALEIAIALGGVGGVSTCAAILTILIGHLSNSAIVAVHVSLFGFAVACMLGALAALVIEVVMAGAALRTQANRLAGSSRRRN